MAHVAVRGSPLKSRAGCTEEGVLSSFTTFEAVHTCLTFQLQQGCRTVRCCTAEEEALLLAELQRVVCQSDAARRLRQSKQLLALHLAACRAVQGLQGAAAEGAARCGQVAGLSAPKGGG